VRLSGWTLIPEPIPADGGPYRPFPSACGRRSGGMGLEQRSVGSRRLGRRNGRPRDSGAIQPEVVMPRGDGTAAIKFHIAGAEFSTVGIKLLGAAHLTDSGVIS
jgi:hypothetical protein